MVGTLRFAHACFRSIEINSSGEPPVFGSWLQILPTGLHEVRSVMSLLSSASTFTLRVGLLLAALCIPIAGAAAQDSRSLDKYPDLRGQWARNFVPRWTVGPEKAPLTPEYQKVYEANLADMANGGPGNVPSWYCVPQGMPMMMNAYDPMELVVTPEITYLLISHVNDSYRRIYTDGRNWPDPETTQPTFSGYSIGKWADEDGDGKYDVLEVETRFIRAPHTYDAQGIPFHDDNQAVIKERIYLDKADKNLLHDDITSYDHALTQPWTKNRTYKRSPDAKPVWFEDACAADNAMVKIGNDPYFLSPDGLLMPTRKDQPPPDVRYFNRKK
jgi:hypothetical protein